MEKHFFLFIGIPGSGKTVLSKKMISLFPQDICFDGCTQPLFKKYSLDPSKIDPKVQKKYPSQLL